MQDLFPVLNNQEGTVSQATMAYLSLFLGLFSAKHGVGSSLWLNSVRSQSCQTRDLTGNLGC